MADKHVTHLVIERRVNARHVLKEQHGSPSRDDVGEGAIEGENSEHGA
jgi:hypothetical protein